MCVLKLSMNAIGHQEATERKETKHIFLIRLIHNWEEQLEAFIWLSCGFHLAHAVLG